MNKNRKITIVITTTITITIYIVSLALRRSTLIKMIQKKGRKIVDRAMTII